jgi:hypothetical protein
VNRIGPTCPQCKTPILSCEAGYFRCWRCHWIGQLDETFRPLPDVPKLEALCKSIRFVRVEDYIFGDGLFHPCNPTVAWHEGLLWLSVRFVSYRLGEPNECGPYHSHNAVRAIDASLEDVDLRPETSSVLREPRTVDWNSRKFDTFSRGFEDIRLFSYKNEMRAIACACDYNRHGKPEQVTFRLLDAGYVRDVRVHRSPIAEKNWLPIVEPDRLLYLYALRPFTIVLDENCQEMSRKPFLDGQAPDQPMLSGSSQAVPFLGGYLLVAHERIRGFYQHRFVHLSDRLQVVAMSKPFSFRHTGVEFCCGAAMLDSSVLFSFGVEDREAWLCEINHSDIERILYAPRHEPRSGESPR